MNKGRSNKLKYKQPVSHAKFGRGIVENQWGDITTVLDGQEYNVFCGGIFDVIFFNEFGAPFRHSATQDHFTN